MSSFYPIIQNFLGGVLSRKAWGNVGSAAYQNSLEYCVNWIISIQGSIRKRAGSQFMLQYDGTGAVVKTLPEKDDDDIVCTFIGNKLYLSDTKGAVKNSPNLVKNGDFSKDKKNWIVDQARNAPAIPQDSTPKGNTSLMAASSNVTVTSTPFGRTLTMMASCREYGSGGVRWCRVIQEVPVDAGGDLHTITLSVRNSAKLEKAGYSVQFNIRIGTTKYGYDLVNKKILVTAGKGDGGKVKTSGNENIVVNFTPAGATVKVYLMFEVVLLVGAPVVDPKHPPLVLYSENYGKLWVNNVVIFNTTTGTEVVLDTPYNIDALPDIQTATDSGKDSMWVVHKDFQPHVLQRNSATYLWEFIPYVLTGGPASWGSGNYPRCVCIYQSRLFFASTPLSPSHIWASGVGKYNDFLIPASVTPDSPLQFDLATPATIRWMLGAKALMIGTDSSEWLLTSSSGVISPTDYQFQMQSAYGCSTIQPSLAGMGVLYASNTNTKLRYIQDGGTNYNAWVSQDILAQAQNISGGTIIDVAYILEPDYQIYMLTSEGVLVRCTFATDSGVAAWSLHVDAAGGRIKSITSVNTPAGMYLYMTTERGSLPEKTFLERTNPQEVFEVLLDSYGLYDVDKQGGISKIPVWSSDDWTVLDEGFNNTGSTIDIRDNNVYVGGNFTVASGVGGTGYIARWDNLLGTWHAMGWGANAQVLFLRVHPTSGIVYAGGKFTEVYSAASTPVPNTNHIAKWDGTSWSAMGSGFDNVVSAIAFDEFGTDVYAGGAFLNSGAIDIQYIARWNGSAWSPLDGNKLKGSVSTITKINDGIFAAGDFVIPSLFSGLNDGFKYKSGIVEDLNLVALSSAEVRTSYYDSINNRVYAAGLLRTASGNSNFMYWDVALGDWVKPYTSSGLESIQPIKDGRVLDSGLAIVSAFRINGSVNTLSIWDTASSAWVLPANTAAPAATSLDGDVNKIIPDPADPNSFYFCGFFTRLVGGAQMYRVGHYNKTTGTYKKIGGGTAGGLNYFVLDIKFAPSFDDIDPAVSAKYFYKGQMVASGAFRASATGLKCESVAYFDSASQLWKPLGTGLYSVAGNYVNSFDFDNHGRIYAVGNFVDVGGAGSGITRIAYFDPAVTSANWLPIGAGIDNGSVHFIKHNNGKLHVTGTFTSINGGEIICSGYAVFNIELQAWEKPDIFAASPLGTNLINTLSFDSSAAMYGFGNFADMTFNINDIAIWNKNEDKWHPVKSGVINGYVNTSIRLDVLGGEYVIFGGLFESASGVPYTKNLAMYDVGSDEITSLGETDGEVLSLRDGSIISGLAILITGSFSNISIGFGGNPDARTSANGMGMISSYGAEEITTGENTYPIADGCFNADGELFGLGGFASSGNYINGLDRLEGRDVTVLGIQRIEDYDDALAGAPENYARRSVFAGYYIREDENKHTVIEGQIEVPEWCDKSAYVGLSYDAEFKTLPLDGGERAGTAQGGSNRFNRVFLRVNESTLPYIRTSSGSSMGSPNSYQPQFNTDTRVPEYGEPTQALVSGDFDISSVGFDQDSAIIISAPQSIRTEVAGIFGKATTSKL